MGVYDVAKAARNVLFRHFNIIFNPFGNEGKENGVTLHR